MTNAMPITKDDLKTVLKELNIATKDDLKPFATKDDLKGLSTKDDLLHLERRLKLRMGKHRNEIFTMVGNLATSTPSRREFESLKSQSRFIAHS
ncbi:MAG: hypothetical protein Q8L37_05950 [Candidatus Gottesmanbacteria bacterium]|nr:hypothetical protein [Candidatus Gottesmanbacteria bacterium]